MFYSLATLVVMKIRPRLGEDKLDELVELFSEHNEGMRAEETEIRHERDQVQK